MLLLNLTLPLELVWSSPIFKILLEERFILLFLQKNKFLCTVWLKVWSITKTLYYSAQSPTFQIISYDYGIMEKNTVTSITFRVTGWWKSIVTENRIVHNIVQKQGRQSRTQAYIYKRFWFRVIIVVAVITWCLCARDKLRGCPLYIVAVRVKVITIINVCV